MDFPLNNLYQSNWTINHLYTKQPAGMECADTCSRVLILQFSVTSCFSRSVRLQPQFSSESFMVGVWERMVGNGAFGSGHGITMDFGF